jgi:sec-independent protein translocase protein TatB
MSLTELILVLFVALILFGPEDLPVIARALGKIVFQVRKYTDEIAKELKDVIDTPGNTINEALKAAQPKPKASEDEKPAAPEDEFLTYEDQAVEESPESQEKPLNPLAELPAEIVSWKQTQAGE